jgi:hypothetical protein
VTQWNAIDRPPDIWLWCASWAGAWLVLTILLYLRPLLSGRTEVVRGLISANSRTLVMFAAFWTARAVASGLVATGIWHWVVTTVIFFGFIAVALGLMGEIGNAEFRGKQLAREVIAGLVALVLVFLWAQGVIHMAR